MTAVKCFAPVADRSARILILGSMPGERSLRANQYYAHPRNSFWPIMARLLKLEPECPYEQRLLAMKASGIALWDVLHSCIRQGSLDADIETDSIEPNDFPGFFRRHPHVAVVYFNGTTAERCYRTHVLPQLSRRPLQYVRLPSTSPAHASLTLEQKAEAWRQAVQRQLAR